jgi:site-specific DNA-methyltransferase (adenine-specific)
MATGKPMKPYYDEDGITIYHGDWHAFESPVVGLVLTDPPYSFEPTGGGIMGATAKDGYHRTNLARLDELSCCEFDVGEFLAAFRSVPIVAFCNKSLLPDYLSIGRDLGFLIDLHVLWKNNPTPVKQSAFLPELEYVAVLRRPRGYFSHSEPFDCYRKFFRAAQPKGDNKLHPAEKPEPMLRRYVSVLCNPALPVLDPFMGSGTTLVAAKNLGRKAIGIEIEERYCEIAVKRLAQRVLDLTGAP